MKYRCPYCRHVLGAHPVPVCPSCKKAIQIPEHLKESVAKIKEAKKKQRYEEPLQAPSIISNLLSFHSPVIAIAIIMVAMFAVLYAKLIKSPFRHGSVEFSDPQAIVNKAANVSVDMAKKELWALRMALEMFKRDCGRYPATSEGILALINNPGELTWKGPYVTFTRMDPWKQHYQYSFTNDTMRIFSSGPDHLPDTVDDVIAAEPSEKDRADYELSPLSAPTNTAAYIPLTL